MTDKVKTALLSLAEFIVEAELNPDEAARETIVDALIDVFGCILAGANQPVSTAARAGISKISRDCKIPAFAGMTSEVRG